MSLTLSKHFEIIGSAGLKLRQEVSELTASQVLNAIFYRALPTASSSWLLERQFKRLAKKLDLIVTTDAIKQGILLIDFQKDLAEALIVKLPAGRRLTLEGAKNLMNSEWEYRRGVSGREVVRPNTEVDLQLLAAFALFYDVAPTVYEDGSAKLFLEAFYGRAREAFLVEPHSEERRLAVEFWTSPTNLAWRARLQKCVTRYTLRISDIMDDFDIPAPTCCKPTRMSQLDLRDTLWLRSRVMARRWP